MMLWDMIVLAGVVAIAVIPFVVFAWWARRRMRQLGGSNGRNLRCTSAPDRCRASSTRRCRTTRRIDLRPGRGAVVAQSGHGRRDGAGSADQLLVGIAFAGVNWRSEAC